MTYLKPFVVFLKAILLERENEWWKSVTEETDQKLG